jgi:Rod binding domain-containing protein
MPDIATVAPNVSALNTQEDKLLRSPASVAAENSKIDKSAKDFESILLASWLQQAEQSFATVPGGEDDDDADAGKEQMMGIAMQAMGAAMAGNGGIGIAKMIARQLHKAADATAKSPPHGK